MYTTKSQEWGVCNMVGYSKWQKNGVHHDSLVRWCAKLVNGFVVKAMTACCQLEPTYNWYLTIAIMLLSCESMWVLDALMVSFGRCPFCTMLKMLVGYYDQISKGVEYSRLCIFCKNTWNIMYQLTRVNLVARCVACIIQATRYTPCIIKQNIKYAIVLWRCWDLYWISINTPQDCTIAGCVIESCCFSIFHAISCPTICVHTGTWDSHGCQRMMGLNSHDECQNQLCNTCCFGCGWWLVGLVYFLMQLYFKVMP